MTHSTKISQKYLCSSGSNNINTKKKATELASTLSAKSKESMDKLEQDPGLMSYADLHGEWETREISIFGAVKSFISQLGIGQELTKVSMPSMFLMPYSILELAGARYLKYFHLLSAVSSEPDQARRMAIVIQYFLACIRDGNFQRKPYNALLGETHNCFIRYPSAEEDGKTSTARFIAEQVTHHPPLTAFHIETSEGLTMDCNVQFSAKFHMNSVSIVTSGDIIIKVPMRESDGEPAHEEVYVIDKGLPDAIVKNVIFGTRSINWTDSVEIMCQTTNTSATLHFDKNEFVKGDIYEYNEEKNEEEHHATLSGYLNSTVNIEYFDTPASSEKSKKKSKKKSKSKKQFGPTDTVLFESEKLQPNHTLYPKQTDPINSLNVWKEVTKHIVANDMASSDVVKKEIEDEQRKRLRATKEEEKKERVYFKFDEEQERWVFKGFPTPN
ncbi:oxysterol binding family protein [Cavenderia fasciculata]|uniref:Oxysterol binding family protein n=1 Tax=Cavenderia fasciculata TaxID=261658 RepID=F4Q0R0_CACFS|nr:oxysterol binding family protein [Cavenderia fasciculata]EGG18411.1 oxysterol binding family protein [Cavenderia fasciculata]|eukprot:XP_004366315.1 oxysterol binding family protein [Cavenderia fasciculata]